jgi:hypothetical protein
MIFRGFAGSRPYTHDLCETVSQLAPGSDCYVGAVNDRAEGYEYPPTVQFDIQGKELDS